MKKSDKKTTETDGTEGYSREPKKDPKKIKKGPYKEHDEKTKHPPKPEPKGSNT